MMRVAALLMAACLLASAAAVLWRWSPPLWLSLAVGAVLRVVVAVLAYGRFPHDVTVSFFQAGQAVLQGRDPLTALPQFQWNFLPFSAYLFAGEIKTGLPWGYAAKLLPIACELVTIVLLGLLVRDAAARRGARLLYALSPVAILVSAWHGQVEPIAICLGIAALVLARRRQAVAAGALLGLAIASKSWPVLFAPGVLLFLPLRRWWRVAASTAVVLLAWLIVIPLALHDSLATALHTILGYRSFTGTWTWSGLLRMAGYIDAGYTGGNLALVQRVGTVLSILAVIAVIVIFRRRSPQEITMAVLLAFIAVTSGGAPQYLLWPVALIYAGRRPLGYPFILLSSLYTGLFYLYAFPRNENFLGWPGLALEVLSFAVAVAAVVAMPWSRPADDLVRPALARRFPRVVAG